jgi:hypothetical protein
MFLHLFSIYQNEAFAPRKIHFSRESHCLRRICQFAYLESGNSFRLLHWVLVLDSVFFFFFFLDLVRFRFQFSSALHLILVLDSVSHLVSFIYLLIYYYYIFFCRTSVIDTFYLLGITAGFF